MQLTQEQKDLIKKINELKKEKNAVILVHNYQSPEIYEVADFIGDSLELSRKAVETDKNIIVFCGVKFMAETAKILNPGKTVLLPAFDAGCPMADMITLEQLKEFKKKHPEAAVVSYVNTNADIKAESDICCTSANASEIVNSLREDHIIFVPDKNLAAYVQTKTSKKIIPWEGFCYVHDRIMEEYAELAKKLHPNAIFIAHPECSPEVLKHADEIISTGGMIKFAKEHDNKEIIVATEIDMVNILKRENPTNKYFTIGKICINMKKTKLRLILDALQKNQYQINVSEEIRIKAKKALDRMLSQKV